MPPRVDDPGIRQYQLNQADVHEVVRHLVDEVGGVATVHARFLDEAIGEFLQMFGR
jgi:hypothetical protein